MHGGTITHHHAVGKDHAMHYQLESSDVRVCSPIEYHTHIPPLQLIGASIATDIPASVARVEAHSRSFMVPEPRRSDSRTSNCTLTLVCLTAAQLTVL